MLDALAFPLDSPRQEFLWLGMLSAFALGITAGLALVFRPRRVVRRGSDSSNRHMFRRSVEFDLTSESELPGTLPEKRMGLRRRGNPIQVWLAPFANNNASFTGMVMDRSITGLRIKIHTEVLTGNFLKIRSIDAPDTIPWVVIEICRSRQLGPGRWEIGCRFTEPLPWNVLLLFG